MPAGSLPPFPVWVRDLAAAGGGSADPPILQAGAGLAMIGLLLALDGPARGIWLDRLALAATVAGMAAVGRPADETEVRDAIHLSRTGADPGPAGRLFLRWRAATRGPPADAGSAEGPDPLAIAANAAACVFRAAPRKPEAALLAADQGLAHRLGWPCAVPLLGLGGGRRSPDLTVDGLAAALVRATVRAWDLHHYLDHRARAVRAVAAKLRAKGAGAVVEALCTDDSLTPRRLPGGLSDRAGRRLFDRLTRLDVVRELTGRKEFRCYGL